MKTVVTLLLSAAVAIGAWTLKEVVELKVSVAQLSTRIDYVTHQAAQRAGAARLEELQSAQLTDHSR